MIKIYLIIFLLFSPLTALAEYELDLKGFKPEQITAKLGKPDQVNSISKSQFQWLYGQSIVFFQDNLVIAWSDNGDLGSRENLANIRDNSRSESFLKNWKNPWTPLEPQSPADVIDDLLRKSN